MKRLLKKGAGWRIGWNPEEEIYKGLVGSDDWAIELTEGELTDFCRLLIELAHTMEAMADSIMTEERIACEAESSLLWLEVEGYVDAYSLRLILNHGRRCEGNWSPEAVAALVVEVQRWKVF